MINEGRGALGMAPAEHEGCATAIGPGAAIALARPDGTVGRYSATVADSALGCPVTVIDGGQVVESGSGRLNSPARVDTFAGGVLERVGDRATVLVQGVSEPPGGTPYLAVSMVDGPATGARPAPALLTVYSTRWGGVVRLLDVPSTLLAAVGAPEPAEFSGAPISLGRARPADPTRTVHELGAVTTTDQTLRRWSALLLLLTGRAGPAPARASAVAGAARRGPAHLQRAGRGRGDRHAPAPRQPVRPLGAVRRALLRVRQLHLRRLRRRRGAADPGAAHRRRLGIGGGGRGRRAAGLAASRDLTHPRRTLRGRTSSTARHGNSSTAKPATHSPP
ncbi:hypothetical protein [Actinomadura sp. BRA 177]|uniref:hypothetical protein n=1 Tax=Actinomadura sp. BRA 177 TaxID=2745202 RepID=UPI00159542CE|nr:hypothetical protein [Actinomadura sp. BRA 177]NVI88660.1 hypothetical protein [Actinomadura sp. BRA 177]